MDEKPLAGVIVTFKPESGRPAVGITDKDGRFQLEYSYGVSGTKVGMNTVGLSWPIGAAGQPEIPARYSGKSELTREVKAGKNTFEFALNSEPASRNKKRAKHIASE